MTLLTPAEEYECDSCNDTGERTVDESDGEGHYAPTGTQKCICRIDVDTYEPETDY